MDSKEAEKVLNELQNVRPEVLNGEAKRLFEAIMKIADERDELKRRINDKIEEIKEKKIEDTFISASQGKLDTIIALESVLYGERED